MDAATYYALAIAVAVFTAIIAIYRHLDAKDRETRLQIEAKDHDTRAQIDSHVAARNAAIDSLKMALNAQYTDMMRKVAEIGERIATDKLERIRDLQTYVTRAEFDRRIERFENMLAGQGDKMDDLLRQTSGLPGRKG